jgi:hypothetical protein
MRNCLMCDVALEAGTNWYIPMMKKKHYRCIPCDNKVKTISNPKRMYVNGKYIRMTHPLYKPGKYKTFNDAAFAGTYKLDSIKEGYVYVITNKAWPEWVKIGMAIDAEDRLNGYQTSSPMRDFVLEHSVASNDRRKSEKEAHTRALPLSLDSKGEWFKLSVDQAITILDNLNEHGYTRATKEADTHTEEDNIQGSLF